jgi:hypothetical protein
VFCEIIKELLTSYASFEEQSFKNIIERLKTFQIIGFQIIGMQITSRHLRSVIRKSAADNEKRISEKESRNRIKKVLELNTKFSSSMNRIKILPALLKIILKYSFVYKLYFFVNSQNTTALQYGKE